MNPFRPVTRLLTVVAVSCTLTSAALATSFVVPTDAELIEKADAIIRGVVVSSRVVESGNRLIETVYEIAVTRGLKGLEDGGFVSVRSPGGTIAGRFLIVQSAAHFSEGEEVLLFLSREGGKWSPTDMTLGKFRPALTSKGYGVLVRDDEHITGWTADGRLHVEKLRLETDFVRFIEDTLRGDESLDPYEADAADVVAPAPAGHGIGPRLSTNALFPAATYAMQFLDCENRRWGARWATATMIGGVPFYKNSANGLTGAGDGGVASFQTALASWNGDSGSFVNLTYAGTGPELALEDSKNMLVFNDPQGLIAGSWTGSGTIATTFLYGGVDEHTLDGGTFLNIIDADIVFQDNYTAGEISLEEAMTHEVGHAIGLRHSDQHYDLMCTIDGNCVPSCSAPACNASVEECAATAIMTAVVINTLGYALQTWDAAAANALYPPAAASLAPPTNVQALASTGSNVLVSWSGSDGATSYTVWRSDGGPFVPIGSPSPPAATSFVDEFAGSNKSYIYKVQAHNASGSSLLSGGDIATTIIYTDPTLTAGMLIKAIHLTQLRMAADQMHALAGLPGTPAYTDTIVVGSTTAKAVHFQEVEAALLNARSSLGMSVPAVLGIAQGAVIPAAHINALRTYAQ